MNEPIFHLGDLKKRGAYYLSKCDLRKFNKIEWEVEDWRIFYKAIGWAMYQIASSSPKSLPPATLRTSEGEGMKTLSEQINLTNTLQEIALSDLRAKPGDVFEQVKVGACFIITKHGHVVGAIVPLNRTDLTKVVNPDGKVTWKP